MAARKTPVMQQHAAQKRLYPDCLLFFRLGDFYEMFGDDAVECARLLDLTLTSRNKGKPDEIPMAGVPHHAAHTYLGRLLKLGRKVAICEQMADPATVKGIVPREVVRVLTPGLVTEREHLEPNSNNWLAAVEIGRDAVGVALLDLSTGELCASRFDDLTAATGELARSAPSEVLLGASGDDPNPSSLRDASAALSEVLRVTVRDDAPLLDGESAAHLGPIAEEAAPLDSERRVAVARVMRYAAACNPRSPLPVRRISHWDPSSTMIIDEVAQAHLELTRSTTGDRKATLLAVLDETRTAPGARMLRRRLLAPLVDVQAIRRRHDEVELFTVHSAVRTEMRGRLERVGDIERACVRAELGEATPRDLGALRDGLNAASEISQALQELTLAQREALGQKDALPTENDLAALLTRALVERPPAQAKEGAIFIAGYDPELDELDDLRRRGTEHIVALEARLREETGIGNLKARYTRVFGWYIEVARSQVSRVPKSWRRKQTVASGERYTMSELDDIADRVAGAEERHRARELALLRAIVEQVAARATGILDLSRKLAAWDCSAALAEIAHRYDFVRPVVDDSDGLVITGGRHPVVERLAAAGRFVPNDVDLACSKERLWIITGPNMAGKSTFLRQVALCAVLAQMGSYVPADSARIGVVDRLLSRVGASDNLAGGESTFMVEMRETAEILRNATSRSLVILDEIGRGTSTFDGLAIAWAVAEYLDEAIACRALFATHYHELTALAESSEHVANYSVSARELDGDVVFLHRVVAGAASRSYGVAVAKLAGLPHVVLARAQAILASLERGGETPVGNTPSAAKRRAADRQLDLFQPRPAANEGEREVLDTLASLDVERLTPLDALQLLATLKRRI